MVPGYSQEEKDMNHIIGQLKKLTAIGSPSGLTAEVTGYTMERFKELGFAPYLTNKGCAVCNLHGWRE
jgi:putative aminopeptidase FrvX